MIDLIRLEIHRIFICERLDNLTRVLLKVTLAGLRRLKVHRNLRFWHCKSFRLNLRESFSSTVVEAHHGLECYLGFRSKAWCITLNKPGRCHICLDPCWERLNLFFNWDSSIGLHKMLKLRVDSTRVESLPFSLLHARSCERWRDNLMYVFFRVLASIFTLKKRSSPKALSHLLLWLYFVRALTTGIQDEVFVTGSFTIREARTSAWQVLDRLPLRFVWLGRQ